MSKLAVSTLFKYFRQQTNKELYTHLKQSITYCGKFPSSKLSIGCGMFVPLIVISFIDLYEITSSIGLNK